MSEWLGEPLEKEELRFLQRRAEGLQPLEWLKFILARKPMYPFDIFIRARQNYGMDKASTLSLLKRMHEEGYRFCKIANLNATARKSVRTPMLIMRGTEDEPYRNCINCPALKQCRIRGEKHGK